jgi:hypothetical protein
VGFKSILFTTDTGVGIGMLNTTSGLLANSFIYGIVTLTLLGSVVESTTAGHSIVFMSATVTSTRVLVSSSNLYNSVTNHVSSPVSVTATVSLSKGLLGKDVGKESAIIVNVSSGCITGAELHHKHSSQVGLQCFVL